RRSARSDPARRDDELDRRFRALPRGEEERRVPRHPGDLHLREEDRERHPHRPCRGRFRLLQQADRHGAAAFADCPADRAGGAGHSRTAPMKVRADVLVQQRGLAESRTRAQALILAGSVIAGDHRVDKPGQLLDSAVELRLKEQLPYVSRGGLKLEKALDQFALRAGRRSAKVEWCATPPYMPASSERSPANSDSLGSRFSDRWNRPCRDRRETANTWSQPGALEFVRWRLGPPRGKIPSAKSTL